MMSLDDDVKGIYGVLQRLNYIAKETIAKKKPDSRDYIVVSKCQSQICVLCTVQKQK